MKQTHVFSLSAAALASLALFGCGSVADKTAESPAKDTVVAVYTTVAPNLAAGAADPVWASARPLTADLTGGANFGAKPGEKGDTKVTLKAAYTSDTLYMLIQYKDPTNSIRRFPYQKQADGSWKKLVDPADKGGDDNIYYEDKWAMLWPTNEAIRHRMRAGPSDQLRRLGARSS